MYRKIALGGLVISLTIQFLIESVITKGFFCIPLATRLRVGMVW